MFETAGEHFGYPIHVTIDLKRNFDDIIISLLFVFVKLKWFLSNNFIKIKIKKQITYDIFELYKYILRRNCLIRRKDKIAFDVYRRTLENRRTSAIKNRFVRFRFKFII